MKKYNYKNLNYFIKFILVILLFTNNFAQAQVAQNKLSKGVIAIQSDLGLQSSSIASMKGVILTVNPLISIVDISHNIPSFNIWDAAFLLSETIEYLPENAVFISIVDPAVGTGNKSIIVKNSRNQYIITPDNGTLSIVKEAFPLVEIREFVLEKNHRPGASKNYNFLGRDYYAYTAALLVSGELKFEDVGPIYDKPIVNIKHQAPELKANEINGCIVGLDEKFGNLWTNIRSTLWNEFNAFIGERLEVRIYHLDEQVYAGYIPYVPTFASVPEGKPLIYLNSQESICLASNRDNFSQKYGVLAGPNWTIKIKKISRK